MTQEKQKKIDDIEQKIKNKFIEILKLKDSRSKVDLAIKIIHYFAADHYNVGFHEYYEAEISHEFNEVYETANSLEIEEDEWFIDSYWSTIEQAMLKNSTQEMNYSKKRSRIHY